MGVSARSRSRCSGSNRNGPNSSNCLTALPIIVFQQNSKHINRLLKTFRSLLGQDSDRASWPRSRAERGKQSITISALGQDAGRSAGRVQTNGNNHADRASAYHPVATLHTGLVPGMWLRSGHGWVGGGGRNHGNDAAGAAGRRPNAKVALLGRPGWIAADLPGVVVEVEVTAAILPRFNKGDTV